MVDQFVAYLTRSAASGSRTTALAPLHMVLALVLAAFLTALGLNAPEAVLWLFGGFCTLTLLLECVAYVYLLFADRDALRSERFTLEKMRIEKGILGDTLSGFREVSPSSTATALPAPTEGEKQ